MTPQAPHAAAATAAQQQRAVTLAHASSSARNGDASTALARLALPLQAQGGANWRITGQTIRSHESVFPLRTASHAAVATPPRARTRRALPDAHTRALSSSERGRNFRNRERAREEALMAQVRQLREEIAALAQSHALSGERALMTRVSSGGSLERLTRELYAVFRFGLSCHEARYVPRRAADAANSPAIMTQQLQKEFLRRIADPDVEFGDDVVGVDGLIEQWRKHTLSYSRLEIEVVRFEPIAGSETHPIVVIHANMHARLTRKTLPRMFPGMLERRPDLVARLVDRDYCFDCVSRFTFSETGQILVYSVSVNFVEGFVKALGSVHLVAELMQFSIVTPSATYQDDTATEQLASATYQDDAATEQLASATYLPRSSTAPSRMEFDDDDDERCLDAWRYHTAAQDRSPEGRTEDGRHLHRHAGPLPPLSSLSAASHKTH